MTQTLDLTGALRHYIWRNEHGPQQVSSPPFRVFGTSSASDVSRFCTRHRSMPRFVQSRDYVPPVLTASKRIVHENVLSLSVMMQPPRNASEVCAIRFTSLPRPSTRSSVASRCQR
jgi:hypothetical protein